MNFYLGADDYIGPFFVEYIWRYLIFNVWDGILDVPQKLFIFKIAFEIIKEKRRKTAKNKVHKLKIKKIKKTLDTNYV